MTRQAITKHGRDHRPPGTLGTDDPGGHDPIPWPKGLVAGQTSVDLAYRLPGDLCWLYRLGETTTITGDGMLNFFKDTSAYDATPRNMTYHENSGAAGWLTANRPTLGVADTAISSGDDGAVHWNWIGTNDNSDEPGAYASSFVGAALGNFDVGKLQTAMVRFNADAGYTGSPPGYEYGLILGTYDGSGSSPSGWGFFFQFNDSSLHFVAASTDHTITTGMIPGTNYHLAATFDGTDYRFYLNAVLVDTWTHAAVGSAGVLSIGGGVRSFSFGGQHDFFKGMTDDAAGFLKCLTRDEIAVIYTAVGFGTTTSVVPITITAGDPTLTAGAVSSALSGGGDATQHQVMAADGAGATDWEWPTHGVYVEGV